MVQGMKRVWRVAALLMMATGCGPVIAPEVAKQADRGVDWAMLATQPERYRGHTVILGGEIGTLAYEDGKSWLLILQMPVDKDLRALDNAASGGEFWVESEGLLDKTAYVQKRKITVAGEVMGVRQGAPWLKARQTYLWEHPFKLVPIPPEWYGNDPALEYWFTPPYYDPYRHYGVD